VAFVINSMETEEMNSELNLFEGLEGFENFNPLDDNSLLAILDDLEEGTLMSMLDNKTLLNDVSGEISNDIQTPCKSTDFDVMDLLNNPMEQPQCELSEDKFDTEMDISKDPLTPETLGPVVKKSPVQEALLSGNRKRARMDPEYLVSCIEHDHCYSVRQPGTPAASSSDEEGSLSDAGTVHYSQGTLNQQYYHYIYTYMYMYIILYMYTCMYNFYYILLSYH